MTTNLSEKTINEIATSATNICEKNNSEYLTNEHVMYAILKNEKVSRVLGEIRKINQPVILKNLEDYFSSLPKKYQNGQITALPSATETFKVAIYGAKIKPNVDAVHIYLSFLADILSHKESYSYYAAATGGLTVEIIEEILALANSVTYDEFSKIVAQHCTNMNEHVAKMTRNPLIGREKEIDNIELVVGKKNKPNVVLVGEAGTGKTVIVEGLVYKILNGEVNDRLKNATIWSTDVGSLVAGAKLRGDMEKKVKDICDALTEMNKESPQILFIDEIHMIVNSGSSEGSLDIANILKPYMARGNFRIIGATTDEEYRKYLEKDSAIKRRLEKIIVHEPSISDTILIVNNILPNYEEFHSVKYGKKVVSEVVNLSHRYMTDKRFPDKAIDIIDRLGSRMAMNTKKRVISILDVETMISEMVNIPQKTISEDDNTKLLHLEENLKIKVIGQDKACSELADAVILSRTGLREAGKTIGNYLMVGHTGTGKTFMAKTLSEDLSIPMVKFDMSEYREPHSISKMIGAPPGYAGFGDGKSGSGLLINALEKNPHCVLLFDEIEKAHKDVFNLTLQMMEDGVVTSSDGKKVYLDNVIFVMTSNAGVNDISKSEIGFSKSDNDGIITDAILKRYFSPEMLNRFDAIIQFNKFDKENIRKISDIEVDKVIHRASERGIKIVVKPDARQFIADNGYSETMGARPLKRFIQDNLSKTISKKILLDNKIKNITFGMKDGEMVVL